MPAEGKDYNSLVLKAQPNGLKEKAEQLKQHNKTVGAILGDINKVLKSLQLGWAGQTAGEVEDITNKWAQVLDTLFGTEKEPENGVLNALAAGVATSAANFGNAENTARKMFQQMLASLNVGKKDGLVVSVPTAESEDFDKHAKVLKKLNESPPKNKDHLDSDATAIGSNYVTDYSEGDKENERMINNRKTWGVDGDTLDSYRNSLGGVNYRDD